MYHEEISRPAFSARMGSLFDRAETVYLRALRAVILLIATLLLGYAAWLGASSLYKITRSPDSVKEAVATVAADELTNAEMPTAEKTAAADGAPVQNPEHRRFYADFVKRYYNLFRTRFEPFKQREDKQLARDEFDDSFLDTASRLEATTSGELNFDQDKADLEGLLRVMTEAAEKPVTQQRLERYRSARKVAVQTKVQRTRTTYRRGWDTYSTACSDWYESPMGCAVQRAIQTPYTETVTKMEFPKNTQSHTQIFRAFQDRYYQLLLERREANAAKAESERQGILAGILDGQLSLMTTLWILAGFLILMFFFLLIAIERHQRRIALAPTSLRQGEESAAALA